MRQMVFNINAQHAKITEVIPGLFVSGVCALTPTIIAGHDIRMIVNATEEVPNVKSLGMVEYVKLWLKDTPETNIHPHFSQLFDQIRSTLKHRKNVLIHSVQGVSRCAAICLAYLTKFECKTLKDAHALLCSKRPMVKLNSGFWKQLIAYEQEIKQTSGSLLFLPGKKNQLGCLQARPQSSSSRSSNSQPSDEPRTSSQDASNNVANTPERDAMDQESSLANLQNPEAKALASLAQVFYREIKKRSRCRRRICPAFKPVLETLYEQTEISV